MLDLDIFYKLLFRKFIISLTYQPIVLITLFVLLLKYSRPDPTISALNRASLTSAGGDGLSPPSNDTSDNYTTPGVMLDGQPTPQGQGYLVPIPAVSFFM